MKKLFLLLAFFSCVSFASNAQSCNKSASASKSCCAKTTAAAAKLAAADDTIEAKTCSKSGKVSYHKNYTCSVSGKTSVTEVTYDAKANKFVNISPSKMAKENASGGKNVNVKAVKTTKAKKSCDPAACKKGSKACTKSAKAVKTSASKKSCDPKNCDPAKCKKGAAKTSNAKLVKAEN